MDDVNLSDTDLAEVSKIQTTRFVPAVVRRAFLKCHATFVKVMVTLWRPMTILVEGLNGTEDMRDRLNRMD